MADIEKDLVEETGNTKTEHTSEAQPGGGSGAENSRDEEKVWEKDAGEAEEEHQKEAQPAGEKAGEAVPEKKGFFKKKEKKDKKDEEIEELNDRLKRSLAEFENFRKRTEKEKAAMYEIGAKSVIEKILPVVDNFERGMATLNEEDSHSPFAEGMDKIYKQLLTTLEALDVKPIEAVGQEFNPDFHNAVMHVEDETSGENIVVEELQKGYFYRDSVVRHSMVKVAN